MGVAFDCFGMTDLGRVRRNNEDQFLVAELVKRLRVVRTSVPDIREADWSDGVVGHLLVVADGMGGMAGGEVASGLAVETISWYVTQTMPWFYRQQDGREAELEAELRQAVEACQRTVADAAANSHLRRMGTTLTMAYVLWPRVYVVHAGDSRCYLRRGTVLHRMTKDHTVAQRAVDAGVMTAAQAENSPLGHALWNCIGGCEVGVKPDVYKATLEPGDELLLCSDGLTRRLSDVEVGNLLLAGATAEAAARSLVQAANDAGGEDNITVVVARLGRPVAVAPAVSASAVTPVEGTAELPRV
ncbi:MAG: serine/threonine-protein phosphatase [Isosphaera sp.]|nr:serine/threonine-protein phosphatase [Isosphaera sp.]